MNEKVDISLIVALRTGIQLAFEHLQRVLLVIGMVTLSVITVSAFSALLMLLVARISTAYAVVVTVHVLLFVLANIIIHGFSLWYFQELLRIVRGYMRTFADMKNALARGWQLLVAQLLFAIAVSVTLVLFTYPVSLLAPYFNLPRTLIILLILVLYLPALYVAARLCLYPFFLADGKGIVDSLRESFVVTREHAFKLMPMGIVRILSLLSIIMPPFSFLTIPALLKVGLVLMAGLYLAALFDLAAAHIYQRLTHPDQASVPPGVHPLD